MIKEEEERGNFCTMVLTFKEWYNYNTNDLDISEKNKYLSNLNNNVVKFCVIVQNTMSCKRPGARTHRPFSSLEPPPRLAYEDHFK